MKKTCHNLLLLLLLFSISVCYAAPRRDTTLKNMITPLMSPSVVGPASFQFMLMNGISKIKHDSISDGINLILQVLDKTDQLKQAERGAPYQFIEMRDLMRIIGNKKLTPQEKNIANTFVKLSLAGDQSVSEKKFKSMLARAPETNLITRLSIFTSAVTDTTFSAKIIKGYLAKDSTLVFATMLMADKLYADEEYQQAQVYCSRAIRMRPEYAYMYELRGKCYAQLNKNKQAVTDFEEALKLAPTNMEVFYEKADALMDLDKYREAVEAYKQICILAPTYQWCSYNLARAYKNLNKLDSAMYHINNHIRENTDDGDGYDVKGDIYYAGNEYKNALTCYNQAIALKPGKRAFYEDRGDAYLADNQYDTAIVDFKKAISLDSTRSYPIARIGDCYFFSNRYQDAIPYYRKAISISPNYKYCYEALNRTYTHLNNYTDAINSGLKAVAIDSTYATALGNLGWTYYCAGEYDNCINYSYKALKYNKEAVFAMFNIALATLHKGEIAKAKELYTGFVKTCNEHKYKINDGAATDLKDLIKAHVYEADAQYIISNILGN